MTIFGKIRVGNLGTDFQMLVKTTDVTGTINTITDLSTSTSITITLTDPTGRETTHASTALNPPGTDGIAHFVTSLTSSIWTSGGLWTARTKVLFNDGSQVETEDESFQVLP